MRAKRKQYETMRVAKQALMAKIGHFSNQEELAARAQEVFLEFDTDGSGKIDTAELKAALAQLGQSVKEEELLKMIAEIDEDGDGLIDPDEWRHLVFSMFGYTSAGEEAAPDTVDIVVVEKVVALLKEALA